MKRIHHFERSRWAWLLPFGVVALGLVLGGVAFYRQDEGRVKQARYEELYAIGQLKVNQITEWRQERLGDAYTLSQDVYLAQVYELWANDRANDDLKVYLQMRMEAVRLHYHYEDVILASPSGDLEISAAASEGGLNPNEKSMIDSTVAARDVTFGDFYRCAGCTSIHIDILTPLWNASGDVVAVVILRVDPESYLYPLIQSWPTPSQTAETVLVRRDGEDVLFLNELRFRENSALELRTPLTDATLPAVKAVLGYSGYFEGVDYRGVAVLADIRPVPGTPWYMVAKVDADEILVDVNSHAWVTAGFVLLGILLVGASIAIDFNRRQRTLYAELLLSEQEKRRAERLFRTTLYSIGDAVITTDVGGCIQQMNPAAETLTGWSEAEAQGKPLEDAFHIVHAISGEAVENPVQRVLQEGLVVGLANHTALIARDGTVRQIADSGAPIHNEDGKTLGVVMVFRDVTEEYRMREALTVSEEQYRLLFENIPQGFALHEMIFDEAGRPVDYRFLHLNPAFERLTGLNASDLVGKTVKEALPNTEQYWIDTYGKVVVTGETVDYENYAQELGKYYDVRAFRPRPGQFAVIVVDITKRIRAEQAAFERARELEALFSLSTRLREAATADDLLPLLLSETRQVVVADSCGVALVDPDGEHYTIVHADGDLSINAGLRFRVDEGVNGQGLQTRQPYATIDYANDPHRPATIRGTDEAGPAIMVPIQSESAHLGVLIVIRRRGESVQPYTDQDVRLLGTMGEMAGNALRRARLFDEAQRRLRHTQALHDIDLAIAGNLDLEVALNLLLDQSLIQLDVDAASVLLFNPHALTLSFAAGRGFHTRTIQRSRLRLGQGEAGKVALERKPAQLPDLETASVDLGNTSLVLDEGFKAYYAVPLIAKGEVKGVLEVFHRSPRERDREWLEFLETLGSQAAIAIDNLTLFADLQRSNTQLALAYDATIAGWSMALDLRDKETEGHTLRVTELTERLARTLGIQDQDIVHIRRGALLHDIGKIGIPDKILLKPDKLDPQEWEIMHRHPQYARDMLLTIEYLRPALDIPYYHHEKWDGTGYPNGLKGEAIPLAARLFAVVDVYDALTSERPYRPAWTREAAIAYIQEQAGHHFDPQIAQVFLAHIRPQDEDWVE